MPRPGPLISAERIVRAGVIVTACATWLGAQGARPPVDRLRSLATQGDSAGARRLADSLVADTAADAAVRAEGHFWRGALAASSRDRRLEFARVVVDYPLTSVAGDALFRIAQMDLVAGDRMSARRQLQRAFRDYGASTTSGEAAFELGQLLLADGDARGGCAAIDSAIQRTPSGQVERRNRMTYARRPCSQLVTEPPPDSQPQAESSGRSGAPGNPPPPPTSRGATTGNRPVATPRRWSAQVGAFASKEDADRVATRLVARGYEARVTEERPFRVRIGRFAKRTDAAAVVAKLKAEKSAAILVEAERP